mmetsp:Transcript_31346/g.76261  ORF Transcript_31346/g.76261 Transcript_31346/m.76261 type:complete len:226 (+) Transcript_31346:870-1547(+)
MARDDALDAHHGARVRLESTVNHDLAVPRADVAEGRIRAKVKDSRPLAGVETREHSRAQVDEQRQEPRERPERELAVPLRPFGVAPQPARLVRSARDRVAYSGEEPCGGDANTRLRAFRRLSARGFCLEAKLFLRHARVIVGREAPVEVRELVDLLVGEFEQVGMKRRALKLHGDERHGEHLPLVRVVVGVARGVLVGRGAGRVGGILARSRRHEAKSFVIEDGR